MSAHIYITAVVVACLVYFAATQARAEVVCPVTDWDDFMVVQIPSPTNCNVFYKCSRGVAYKEHCSDGLHYNPDIEACDFPSRANCRLIENI